MMMSRVSGVVALGCAVLLGGLSCSGGSKGASKPDPKAGVPLEQVGLSEKALDRGADPCVDFYQYACGGWLKNTQIPGDQARWGRGFSEIQQRNEHELRRLLEQAGKGGGEASEKVGAFYASCMDEQAIEKNSEAALKQAMMLSAALAEVKDVSRVLAKLHAAGVDAIFHYDIDQDFKDPNLVIAYLYQGGLGLPDRDYYVNDDERSKQLRAAYTKHVESMFRLAGIESPDATANVLAIETDLARLHKTRVEMRDVKGLYNPVGRDGLAKLSKSIDWNDYYQQLGFPALKDIAVSTPKLFEGLDGLLSKHKLEAWKAYFQWRVIDGLAMSLSKKFVDEKFKMSQLLTGQKQLKPRWKRCVAATNSALPDYVGQLYIKTMFPGNSKQAAEGMVHAISAAFAANVGTYKWMGEQTRAKALEKRNMMAYLIGYPNKWKTYTFGVDPTQYVVNVLAGRAAKQHHELSKVGKPVDRNEWLMSPSTVNAYYHPLKNHMVFPAGILQTPFYNVKAAAAVNLGGMGMIVGHELTHGFDDMGSQFAGSGKLENWWSAADKKAFDAKKQCVIDQYNNYEILPGVKVNGKLTLGENIADMGGIKLAYQAYRNLRKDAKPVIAGGYNEDQQFFLAVGQAWCTLATDKITRMLVKIDSHSPPKWRVNGALTSVPEFAKAFSCKKGAPMNPTNRCTVW